MATCEEIIKRLNKEFKNDNLIVKGDFVKQQADKLPTKALGMDYPLFGGLPLGHICVYSGLPHSGKTTAACCELAAYQRKFPDRACFYIDVEHRLNLAFQAKMNGVDVAKLNYVNVPVGMSGEQVLDLILECQKGENVGMIILDSVPALIPAAVLNADMVDDPGMRGTIAKKLYPFLAMMKAMTAARNNIFLCINQVRDGGVVNGIQLWKEACGNALEFYSSVKVRFGKRKFTLADNMNACASTNGEGSDGFRLQFKIIKNSEASPTRGGGFITYRYDTGLDWLHDMIEIAEGFDFILKSGSWRTLINCETGEAYKDENGNILKGYMKDLAEYIRTHKDFQDEYTSMLTKHISNIEANYGSLLSREDADEIDAQETIVAAENKKAKGE